MLFAFQLRQLLEELEVSQAQNMSFQSGRGHSLHHTQEWWTYFCPQEPQSFPQGREKFFLSRTFYQKVVVLHPEVPCHHTSMLKLVAVQKRQCLFAGLRTASGLLVPRREDGRVKVNGEFPFDTNLVGSRR